MNSTHTPRPQHRSLLALALMAASAMTASNPVSATEPAPFRGLAAEMTARQLRETGVDGLSSAQREALDAWLRARISGAEPVKAAASPAPTPAAVPAVVPAAVPATPEPTPASAPVAAPVVGATGSATVTTANDREAAIEAEVERRVAEQMATPRNSAEAAELGEAFEASLTGPFTGWSGKTLFRLDNGHVWKQRSKKKFRYNGTDRRVSFKKNFFGGWEMTLIGADETVLVTPVR